MQRVVLDTNIIVSALLVPSGIEPLFYCWRYAANFRSISPHPCMPSRKKCCIGLG